MPSLRITLPFACLLLAALQLSGCGSPSTTTTPPPAGVRFIQTAGMTTPPAGAPENFSVSFNGSVTPGNTIVMVFWWMHPLNDPGISGVFDSQGNAYQLALDVSAVFNSSTTADILYYYAPNAKGGAPVTVTIGTTAPAYTTQVSMVVMEYSGVSSVDAVNATAIPPTGTTFTTGTSQTHASNEVVIGSLLTDYQTPIGAGTGYNTRFASDFFVVEDKIVSTEGNYDAEFYMPPPYPQYLAAIPSMVTLR